MKDCIISTSKVNSYGFRVLTKGIDISQFEKNPILLWMHSRSYSGDSPLPLGRIENLRLEGDALKGTPVFDEKDEFALQIKNKWESGVLNMVSAGLDVVEQSDDDSLIMPGQRYSTVTKSNLREVSIVDIGANPDALGFTVELSADDSNDFKTFLKPIKTDLNLRLGEIEKRLTSLEGIDVDADAQIEKLINENIHKGRINAKSKDLYMRIGANIGIEDFTTLVDTLPLPIRLGEIVNGKSGVETQKLFDYKADELTDLYNNNRELYNELYQKQYGIAPQNENI